MTLRLLQVIPDPSGKKKFEATFITGPRQRKKVSFGAAGSEDFTIHNDTKKKDAYIARHQPRENWNDPTTAGALSRWLLWNKPTLEESIKDFKKMFNI